MANNDTIDSDAVAQLKDTTLNTLNNAFEDDATFISTRTEANSQPLHSRHAQGAVGAEIQPTTTVIIEHPDVQAEITLTQGRRLVSFDNDDDDGETTHISLAIEDDEADYACPVCDRTFDSDDWIETGGYHCRSGGKTDYDCPTADCAGDASVYI